MGKKTDNSGVWHRVCLNTIVRKGQNLDSERLRILPMGSKVFVKEQRDRRVRIEQPIAGWCSLRSSNGDTILTPLDDTDGVPTSTPLAGEIRTNQANAHEHLEAVQTREAQLKNQLTESTQGNAKLTEITKELERLQEEVKDAEEVSKDLEQTRKNVQKTAEELAEMEEAAAAKAAEKESLENTIAELKAQLENEASSQILDLQQRLEQARQEKYKALNRVGEFDQMAQAAEEEVMALKQEMSQLFFTEQTLPMQTSEIRYRMEDVIMLDGGIGIACVRFWGQVHWDQTGPKYVGVELSDAFGDSNGTVDDTTYFECEQDYGMFCPVDQVKKKITAEALLHKLQQAVKMQAQEDTSAE